MQVTSQNATVLQNTNTENRPPRPEGPPPKGAVPPGLENAVSSLTDEQQSLTTEMMASLTEEQHQQLKSILDELKPLTADLSTSDIGSIFFESLTSLYQSSNTDVNNTQTKVDTFA